MYNGRASEERISLCLQILHDHDGWTALLEVRLFLPNLRYLLLRLTQLNGEVFAEHLGEQFLCTFDRFSAGIRRMEYTGSEATLCTSSVVRTRR